MAVGNIGQRDLDDEVRDMKCIASDFPTGIHLPHVRPSLLPRQKLPDHGITASHYRSSVPEKLCVML